MKFTTTIKVAWGDCDAAGIVFWPQFLRWFDAGTENLLEAAGVSYRTLRDEHGLLGFPSVHVESDFRSPVTFGDTVRIDSAIERVGTKSLVVAHSIWVGDRLCAEGSETRVAVRHGESALTVSLAAVPIPEAVRKRLLPAPPSRAS